MSASALQGWDPKDVLLAFLRSRRFELSAPQLARLHRAELIPQPVVVHLGRGKGTVSLYPPGTRDRLLRVVEVRQKNPRFADAAWSLWWEDGGPVPGLVRDRLREVALLWEGWREEIAELLCAEDAAEPLALQEMDKIYRSAEDHRPPPMLGQLRRNTGRAGFSSVIRVFAEVASGRFYGYPSSGEDEEEGTEQLVERALGIDRARADRLADGEPWFSGSSEADLRQLPKAIADAPLAELAKATEGDLERAREELRSFWALIETGAAIFERLFGSRAFGFGTIASVFRAQSAAAQAFLVLIWLVLREQPNLKKGIEVMLAEIPEAMESIKVFELVDALRDQIPAFREALSDKRMAEALLDPERQVVLQAEFRALWEAHGPEIQSLLKRRPELAAVVAPG